MARLVVESGPQAGTTLRLDREEPVTVGTGPDCILRLQDPDVAVDQAVIKALKGSGFGVKSLVPGLRINGREVEAVRLEDGDVLELGGTSIRYFTSDVEESPTQHGGFRLLEELGRGGMGVVYRAEQISLNRQVALKVLSKDLTEDPVFVARFLAEARAAARLHHPNVVQVFDVDHEDDTYFYSMELLHEGSLEDRLHSQGKLPVDEAIQAVADAASGLAYAESLRIVHRDIKPDNLMLDQHGQVKISDLGLALTDEEAGDKVLGTPHFMSPEQVLRKPLDHRSDLYALGCTFYRLITGQTPFSRSTVKDILRAQVKEEPEPVHKVNPEVSPEVSAIIQKLMAKDPGQRYQSANALLEDLQELLAPPSRKALVLGSVALAVVVAGAAVAYALTREQGEPQIIELYRDNPEALHLAQEKVELVATIARLETQLSGLEGLALADALESVAASHPSTEAARQAISAAAAIRAKETRRAEAAATREQAISAQVTQLQDQTRGAMAKGNYREAISLLDPKALPGALREEPRITACLAQLREELAGDSQRRLEALRAAVEQARNDREPGTLGTAVDDLEAILDPAAGWPAELIASPTVLTGLIASWRGEITALQTEVDQLRLAREWERYGAGLTPAIDFLGSWNLEQAVRSAEALAAEIEGDAGGQRAAQLVQVLRASSEFLGHFEAAVDAGTVTFSRDDEQLPVLGFQRSGHEHGLTLNIGRRSRPRPQLVPRGELRAEQWVELANLTNAPAQQKTAFLAVASLTDHLGAARAYLGRIHADRDESGVGDDGYSLDATLMKDLLSRLGDEAWAEFLGHELRAGIRLVDGLVALSQNRPRAGAVHLDQLLEEFPRSILVQALR